MSAADTAASLLAAICADPADDLVRLAYADWLEDQEQGFWLRELIRLGTAGGNPERESVLVDLLKDRFRPDGLWTARPFADYEDEAKRNRPAVFVSRGFVALVRCSLQAWLDYGPALVRAQPIERVEVSDEKHFSRGKPSPSGCYWYVVNEEPPRLHPPTPGTLYRSPNSLYFCPPDPLVRFLDPQAIHLRYPDKQTAVAALSAACLTWAKDAIDVVPMTG